MKGGERQRVALLDDDLFFFSLMMDFQVSSNLYLDLLPRLGGDFSVRQKASC